MMIEDITNIKVDIVNRLNLLANQIDSNVPICGISTGFHDFDEMTSGLHPGNLVTIAGCPSSGKSSFVREISTWIALKCSLPVLFFTLEYNKLEFCEKLLCNISRIDSLRFKNNKLDQEDFSILSTSSGTLSEINLFICDKPYLTPQIIEEKSTEMKKLYPNLSLIVIDYINLVRVESGYSYPLSQQLSEITLSLKLLAKKLNICILITAQINRDYIHRYDKRPILTDLLDSGSIENNSDMIVFIYRDEMFNENSPEKGTAEIILAKNRNGPIGKIRLTFLPQYGAFTNFVSHRTL